MQRYGYLEKGDGTSDALYSEEGVENAIKTLQKFGNIEQTGRIDEETLKVKKYFFFRKNRNDLMRDIIFERVHLVNTSEKENSYINFVDD